MDFTSVVCEVHMESEKVYKIRSFVKRAGLIEVNERLKENPQLLVEKPESDGFLAIMMFKLNRFPQN